MTSREYLVVTLTIILGTLAINTDARSWDFAVVIGRDIEFFSRDRILTGQANIAEAVALAGLAYDDTTHTMYFSDTHSVTSVFSKDLTNKDFTSKPLFRKQNNSYIVGIAFDAKTRTLFWSDAMHQAIMRMHVPVDGKPEAPVLLHDLVTRDPRGIALDSCNSHIYWVNSNSTNPSVERSNLDGTNRTTVIKENLYEPLAVAIDYAEGKLYWIDDVEGAQVEIERSNLDGSAREVLIHLSRQQPIYLAVDDQSIYWTDRATKAVWTAPKYADADTVPTKIKSYYSTHLDDDPAGIVARDNAGRVDCPAIAEISQSVNTPNASSPRATVQSFNNLTTSTEESDLTTESSKSTRRDTDSYCLNDGQVDETDEHCYCRRGFTGAHCETNLCHNYCVHGSCSINSDGLPTCNCSGTFAGLRCETDQCKGYCLFGGQCSVQNKRPICKCKYMEGPRCEKLRNITQLCEIFCARTEPVTASISTTICRCDKANETMAQMIMTGEDYEYKTLLLIFCSFTALLVLVIIVLSYYVIKLRRRPRIRKRFVVSKDGITPLTSRPQLPDTQCEITIENCCNMNICETPCFEPKLRTAGPGTGVTKKEEKNSLIDNMDGHSW